jgi:hypothetical protein
MCACVYNGIMGCGAEAASARDEAAPAIVKLRQRRTVELKFRTKHSTWHFRVNYAELKTCPSPPIEALQTRCKQRASLTQAAAGASRIPEYRENIQRIVGVNKPAVQRGTGGRGG